MAARQRQIDRDGVLNARLSGRALRTAASLDDGARQLVARAMARMALSARGYDRLLRVARTIADIDAQADVSADHVAEALQFRGDY
jgi:magnesium chelatase family protein